METKKINIFGKEISINIDNKVLWLEKASDKIVYIKYRTQFGEQGQIPINVHEGYDKTSEEFIREFDKINYELNKKPYKTL